MERINNLDRIAVSVEEAGKLLGICRAAAYQLARQEGFPVLRVGKRKLINVRALQDWLDAQTAGQTETK